MVCDIFVHAEEGVNTVLEIETTCEKTYTCAPKQAIKKLESATRLNRSCTIVETRGSSALVKIVYPSLDSFIPETPVKAKLLHPYPPYSIADVSIVLDTSPRYDIYGLVARGSTIIASTKRTLLEAQGIVQLVSSPPAIVLGENEVVVDDRLAFETIYPILPSDMHSRGIRLCSARLGLNEERLTYSHGSPGFVLGYLNHLRASRTSLSEIQLRAALIRLYSILPLDENDIEVLAESLSEERAIEPVMVAGGKLMPRISYLRLPVYLRRVEEDREEVLRLVLEKNSSIEVSKWREISVFCKECWEPLSLYSL